MARRRQKSAPMYREMDYLKIDDTPTLENDALVRFYAMLNVVVTFKGRPTYNIEKAVMDIKIKQPLDMAYYKMFQAMLNYPSNRPISALVEFTCNEILFDEIEKLQLDLGLKTNNGDNPKKLTVYQKKARESRMRIYEDTITRFYSMLELFTPYKMRPKLWDEQVIPEDTWEYQIKLPVREAFKTFIAVMREFPTKISKQQELVQYTLHTILPNCETGMLERGLRYQISLQPLSRCTTEQCRRQRTNSIWEPKEDDMKVALGYQKMALRLPSDSSQAKTALAKYQLMWQNAVNSPDKSVLTHVPESHNLAMMKSQLQNLPMKEAPKPKVDYSWIKTDGHRIINRVAFSTPGQSIPSLTSSLTTVTKQETTPTNASVKKKEVKRVQSSVTTMISETEDSREIETQARSYRPTLSPKHNFDVETCRRKTRNDPVYECFRRQNSGYPPIHSKRKRSVKSAPVVGMERRLQQLKDDGVTERITVAREISQSSVDE